MCASLTDGELTGGVGHGAVPDVPQSRCLLLLQHCPSHGAQNTLRWSLCCWRTGRLLQCEPQNSIRWPVGSKDLTKVMDSHSYTHIGTLNDNVIGNVIHWIGPGVGLLQLCWWTPSIHHPSKTGLFPVLRVRLIDLNTECPGGIKYREGVCCSPTISSHGRAPEQCAVPRQ